ncbi:superoxide dismutase [Bacillus chungangensis]|uniref:Superoxide dismutase n=1 Tax=Bacillus chungangensis TaxID=587633 RepID=A0ABT9WTJ3_9BACI|nr:superoxide dismutase [Bacillus chungangensis]MDQ0176506.1 Fe-Mn family superoxide dismutase [Bacillus chungangensis]
MSTFTLPKLQYEYDELEPYIDARTLEIHHSKHHATYVNNLNNALANHESLQQNSLEELLRNVDSLPSDIQTAVRNNGGGHYCHSLFWEVMSPKGGGEPTADIAKEIDYYFKSFDQFKDQLSQAAIGRFGSGYGWLVYDKGKLSITSTPNQDTPLVEDKVPLLVIDVWEHAYYLKYQNRRPEFVTNWWETVNWDMVNERFLQAKSNENL